MEGVCKKKDQHLFHWLPFTQARDWLIPPVSFRAEEKGIGEIGGKIEGEGGDTREEANTSSLERQGQVTFLGLK